MNDEGIPFSIVFDNNRDITNVNKTAKTIVNNITTAPIIEENLPLNPVMNIVASAIRVGKRPLQGTKLLVIIAISLSRGESIILQDVMAAALHPKPIHMDKLKL
ncbi:hypothetical protein SH1V18_03610 [Vallitalea longa]|uniref:Uncharacterized protein n=1 Tax=Vallitalea longa TaxID=2936439 RepID=A0A9W5Y8M4_9FIRM|nr:hypothetical protein SH1V18_03610 [Vallitalea longa]